MTGIEPVICYNPILIDKPQKMLNLISATRLTAEKGKDRIIRMGHLLDEKGIPYTWTIFTNDSYSINNTNIVYRKPKLDIMNYIANSDYLVQLSDGEAYCYSVVEALLVGTPVIVTDCPVFKELGVKDGKNGYILPHDFTDIPDITKIPKKFSFTPPKDIWDELLAPGAREYIPEEVKLIGVVCIRKYFDLQLNKMMMPKDKFIVNEFRAKELIDSKFVRLSD